MTQYFPNIAILICYSVQNIQLILFLAPSDL
jgi:hypothetical protein